MRGRPWTPSPGSSRTGSWRTEAAARRTPGRAAGRGALRPAVAALFLLLALRAGCQKVELTAARHGGVVTADVRFLWNREEELVSSLRDGLESRITFTVRLSAAKPGLLPFLGDTLVAERRVSRSAFYDMLEQRFAMESDGGARVEFEEPKALVGEFLRLKALPMGAAGGGETSVSARVRFEAVRLMPPLGIVTLAGAAASYTSPWVRMTPQDR
jgi:hypothetical protein